MPQKTESMMITIPVEARNKLRIMAAQRNLDDPNKVTSAAEIARHLIVDKLGQIHLEASEPEAQVSQFLADCSEGHPHAITRLEELFKAYSNWVSRSGQQAINMEKFVDMLSGRYEIKSDSSGRYFSNLKLI